MGPSALLQQGAEDIWRLIAGAGARGSVYSVPTLPPGTPSRARIEAASAVR
jgi:hypothetical protein